MDPAPEFLQQSGPTEVLSRRKRLTYFGGCDYYRLSRHPSVRAALEQALDKWGLSLAASRATTGDHPLYHRLERELASFFQADQALLLPTGYTANLAAGESLACNNPFWLLDEKAHPSLFSAATVSGRWAVFRHRDPRSLGNAITRAGRGEFIVVATEGMFGLTGAIPPIEAYLNLLPPRACLLIDDAHAAGILGNHGRGSLEFHGVRDPRILQVITLSKAFGVYGGALLGPAALVAPAAKTPGFSGATPLPLPLAAAALTAVRLLRSDQTLRCALKKNVELTSRLLGLDSKSAIAPIFAFPMDSPSARNYRRNLLRNRVFPSFIHYPGGPAGGFYRFAISSAHTAEEIRRLAAALT